MEFTKTTFQPRDKLPASKINEIQDVILDHEDKLRNVDDLVTGVVKSINDVTPDENGNVIIDLEKGEKGDPGPQGEPGEKGDKGEKGDPGVSPTAEEVAAVLPKTTKLDFTNWNNGSFKETLSNNKTVTHPVVFNANGAPTAVGGITITGVD